MANFKGTKRSLLMSALALVLCVSMLVGSTFAWFTDDVTSTGNIIQSGTLTVTMEYADGKADPNTATWADASTGKIFNSTLWEPGYTDAKHLRVENTGSLALKYQLSIIPTGTVSALANVIDVYYYDVATQVADRADVDATKYLGTLADLISTGIRSGSLVSGENFSATLVFKMQEDAGNEYQGMAIGTDFAVQLLATQMTDEEDHYDDQYDANAGYPKPGYIPITTPADFTNHIDSAQSGSTLKFYLPSDTALDAPLVIDKGMNVEIDLNGNTLTGEISASSGNLEIKNGTIVNEGVATLRTSVPQRVSIRLSGDATAVITDVDVKTVGIGLLVEDNATVTELNANIESIFAYSGSYLFDAIRVDGNGRIDVISGGEYSTVRTQEFMEAWVNSTNKTFEELPSFTISLVSPNASIGQIQGGTFIGEMDKAGSGVPLYVYAGTIEQISGGYFGFAKYTLGDPWVSLYVNSGNGGSIGKITGGTFEAGYVRFNCDFAGIVAASGCQVVDTGETVDVQYQMSTKIRTHTLKVLKVIAQ